MSRPQGGRKVTFSKNTTAITTAGNWYVSLPIFNNLEIKYDSYRCL